MRTRRGKLNASTEDEKRLVTDLGATQTVDYTGDVADAVREPHPAGVEVVLHVAGDPAALLAAVRKGGRFVSTLIGSPELTPGAPRGKSSRSATYSQ